MRYRIQILLILFPLALSAQKIEGMIPELANKKVFLDGFAGLKTYAIDSIQADKQGRFTLQFSKKNYGGALLTTAGIQSTFVILGNENIIAKDAMINEEKAFTFQNSVLNTNFTTYKTEYPQRQQLLNTWYYLENAYQNELWIPSDQNTLKNINLEKKRLKEEEEKFLKELSNDDYLSWFLSQVRLLSSFSNVIQNRPQDIEATKKALLSIDYNDSRWYNSGLFQQAIEIPVLFLENTNTSKDNLSLEINNFTDTVLDAYVLDEIIYNEVAEYLYRIFEQRNFTAAIEHLALKVLNENSCTVSEPLAFRLEGYRSLIVGKTASDIAFNDLTYLPKDVKASKLSDIESPYTLVVFAAGWCSHCQQAMPDLVANYSEYKEKGIEILHVSLDETNIDFTNFAGSFPFISTTDLKKWEGKAVKDYHVFATPSFYLLDSKQTIVLKPQDINQLDNWIANNLK